MDLGESTSRLILLRGSFEFASGDDHPYLARQLSVF
jgi:hypothetical protein